MKNKYIKILIILFSLFSSNIKLYADENNKTICNYIVDISKDYQVHVKGEINYYNDFSKDKETVIYIKSIFGDNNKIKNFKVNTNLKYKKKYDREFNRYKLEIEFPPGMSKIEYEYNTEILKENLNFIKNIYNEEGFYQDKGIFLYLSFSYDINQEVEKNIIINLSDTENVKLNEENDILNKEITSNAIILKGNEKPSIEIKFPENYFNKEPNKKKII